MEITFCPNCGHQNQPGSRFCEECGCDLIQAAAQQEAQMAQQMQQQVQAQQEAQAQQRVQAAKQNMAAQTSFNKPQKPQKQKKSHLGLILEITIPVILIGIAVILILTGVIKLPFMDSGKKLEGKHGMSLLPQRRKTDCGLCMISLFCRIKKRMISG